MRWWWGNLGTVELEKSIPGKGRGMSPGIVARVQDICGCKKTAVAEPEGPIGWLRNLAFAFRAMRSHPEG